MGYDVRDFESEVIEKSREIPVLVDFWAEWCGPCRILGPVLERLAGEAEGRWRLAKVDTEAFPEVAGRFGVRSIPNVQLFVDGAPVDGFVGALPESEVRRWLDRALPSDSDREARAVVEEARRRVFREPEEALRLLDGVEPPPPLREAAEDTALFARLLLKLDDPGTLGQTPAGASYLEAIRSLGREDWDGAAAGFIEAVREDRTLDEDGPRRACVALFRYLGHDHSVVRRWRGELAGALYV
jgi:putative thioredoxin